MDMGLSKKQLMLMEELLVGLRAEIVQRRKTAPSVVERFDVVKHIHLRFVVDGVGIVMHPFTLGNRISRS